MFNGAFIELLKIAPTYQSADKLIDEHEELKFGTQFRGVMCTSNVLQSFADFTWDNLAMDEQQFENYKSKYLDLYDKVRSDKQVEMISVLDEVDFELELIHRDKIITHLDELTPKHTRILTEHPTDANRVRDRYAINLHRQFTDA